MDGFGHFVDVFCFDDGVRRSQLARDLEVVESKRVFVAENGWVAVTGEEQYPVMFPRR